MQGILLFIVIGIASYLTWRKDRNRNYIWFAWINIVGLLIEVGNYLNQTVLPLSPVSSLVINIGLLLVWTAMAVLVVKILFFKSRSKPLNS
jgi:tryptophan-rich sensory protein